MKNNFENCVKTIQVKNLQVLDKLVEKNIIS
jgi:hypothetical protein